MLAIHEIGGARRTIVADREIHDLVLAAADGRQTKSGALSHQEFILGYTSFQPNGLACLPSML
jgi:altronate dehydratase